MFTHKTISSGQRCFPAAWWPSADNVAGTREKEYPLMMFESGQCNRVRKSNLKPIGKSEIPYAQSKNDKR